MPTRRPRRLTPCSPRIFPGTRTLDALNSLADDGVIGSVSERFYGVPTEYSQSRTHADAQEIVAWAKQDGVDAMILVPL
jgi:hypothetical protein